LKANEEFVNYDDEILMAYADGELDEARRAQIAAAIDEDPELARRVAKHRALRTEVAGAYSGVLDQPVPDRLRVAAGARPAGSDNGNVVQFPTRGARARATPWRGREWAAMAASLVLGAFLSWRFLAPGGGDITASDGALLARGDLAAALDTQLASLQSSESPVLIGVTFKNEAGGYCRSFVTRATATAGLACRSGEKWRIPVTQEVEIAGGDLRQAAASMPAAILAAMESRLRGDPLDANQEQAAREAGWQ
jgi:hypothetical protein